MKQFMPLFFGLTLIDDEQNSTAGFQQIPKSLFCRLNLHCMYIHQAKHNSQ